MTHCIKFKCIKGINPSISLSSARYLIHSNSTIQNLASRGNLLQQFDAAIENEVNNHATNAANETGMFLLTSKYKY